MMINVAKIKQIILQRAISGQLIDLVIDDNQEYFSMLINESVNLKNSVKPIDGNQVPFELPKHWRWIQIGLLGKMGMGQTLLSNDLDNAGDAVYSATMSDDYFGYISPNKNRINLTVGDIVIPARGNSIGYVKSVKEENSTCTQTTMYIHLSNKIYKEWIYYSLLARRKDLFEHGGMAIPQITIGVIKNELIPIPPLEEQKRIVARLDEIFAELDKIDEKQIRLATIQEKMEEKILKLAIQGKLVEQRPEEGTGEELFKLIQQEKQQLIKEGKIKKEKTLPTIKDNEIPFEIPSSWKWTRIGDIFTLKAGDFISSSKISKNQTEETAYQCFGGNGLRGYVQKYNIKKTHVLIGRQGALCGNIKVAYNAYYATEHAVVVYQYANTNIEWIATFLKILNLNQYSTSVAQPGLAVSKICNVLIPLPPLEEQKRIVDKIEELLQLFRVN